MAEDIDFKYPMKQACSAEILQFCGDIPRGHAHVIRCLQDHIDDEGMGSECHEEVQNDEVRSSQDYRSAQPAACTTYALCRHCEPSLTRFSLNFWCDFRGCLADRMVG